MMFKYNNVIKNSFHKIRKHVKNGKSNFEDLEERLTRAERYLKTSCSVMCRFSEAILQTHGGSIHAEMSPVIFESAFIVTILHQADDTNTAITSSLASILLKNRTESSFWNYISNLDNTPANRRSNDFDITSICMMGLYRAGYLNPSECRETAEQVLDKLIVYDSGEMASWLRRVTKEEQDLHPSLMKSPTIDFGTIVNTLWFLSNFGLESDARATSWAKVVKNIIDLLIENRGRDIVIPGMIYYSNRFVLYFLLSRYINSSHYATENFGRKFAELVVSEIINLELKTDSKALNLACLSLASINLGIHTNNFSSSSGESVLQTNQVRHRLVKIVRFLKRIQRDDGAYDPLVIHGTGPEDQQIPAVYKPYITYSWYMIGEYVGSKAISTAFALAAINKVRKEIIQGDYM